MRKVEDIIEHVGEGRRNLPQLWTPEPALLAHTTMSYTGKVFYYKCHWNSSIYMHANLQS